MLTLHLLPAATITPLQALVLGAVQGLTELLPVSSSAHLFIVPTLLGWKYEGVAFDVALHGGTLVALVLAFWKEWLGLVRDAFSPDAVLAREARGLWLKLIVASVPAAIVGKLLNDVADEKLRIIPLQAAMLGIFGVTLWAVDRFAPAGRGDRGAGWGAALGMGFAQCLALVPGVSRSGITMTAGRAGGLDRVSAARFSFMLATPITFGALLLKLRHMPNDVPAPTMLVGVVSAALVGILSIRVLLGMLRRTGFGAFAVYRVALAAALFVWVARR